MLIVGNTGENYTLSNFMVVTSITICAEGFYCLAFRSNLHFSENWGSSSSQLLSLVIRPRVELWLNLSRSSVAAHRLKRPELHQNRSRKDHDSSVDFLTGHNYELNLILPILRQNNSKIGNSSRRSLNGYWPYWGKEVIMILRTNKFLSG